MAIFIQNILNMHIHLLHLCNFRILEFYFSKKNEKVCGHLSIFCNQMHIWFMFIGVLYGVDACLISIEF